MAIDAIQREILLEELATLVVSLRDPETRSPWESLAAAVDGGGVEEEELARLESARQQLHQDITLLERHVEEERSRMRAALANAGKDKFPARYEQQLTLYYQNLAAGSAK